MSDSPRSQLYAELLDAMRDSASRALMLHHAVASRFGLNGTDIKALDLARNESELTAGRLAHLTGLTTSAVTALLDRLERRGLIRREHDPRDRRKVIVLVTGVHEAESAPIFATLADRIRATLDEYPEDALRTFLDLYQRINALTRDYTATLPRRDADAPTVHTVGGAE